VWPLVGREVELGRVTGRFPAGGGLLLVGEPGVGKTHLARLGRDAAYAKGARAEWIAGATGASGVPLSAVAHLVPELGDVGPTRLLSAVARALVAPRHSSLLLAVDDAHWLDAASAAVVHHAVVGGGASLLATARRGAELPEPLAALVRDGRVERLDLLPLSAGEVEVLLQQALGGPVEGSTLDKLCAASQGNPMLVRELVRAGQETGALTRRDDLWHWAGPLAGPRLVDLIDARLGRLSAEERAGLEVVALGAPLPLVVAEAVVGQPVLDVLDRAQLLDARQRSGDEPVVRPAHPLYAEVLRATTSTLRRRVVHRQLAQAFEDAGLTRPTDVVRIVTWRLDAQVANRPVDLRAAAHRALGASDFELAERIARAGVDGNDEPSRVALALAVAGQGRIDEAHRLLATAGSPADQVGRAVDLFFYGSRTTSAAAAVERVQDLLAGARAWPADSEPLVEAARAGVLLLAGSVDEARAAAGSVLATPDAPAVAKLRAVLVAGPSTAIAGRTAEAMQLAAYGVRLLAGGAEPASVATEALVELDAEPLLPATLSLAARFAGDLVLAKEVARHEYQEALAARSPAAQGLFALALGHVAMAEGRPEHALPRLREAVGLLRHPPALTLVWALGYLGQAAALVGDLESARAAIAEADAERGPAFQVFDCDVARARAWTLAADGEVAAAQDAALDAATVAAEAGQVSFAAEAAHDAARLGAADRAAPVLAELATRGDGGRLRALARHAAALADDDPAELLGCADELAGLGMVLLAAEASACASRRLTGPSARAAAARAAALVDDCGAVSTPALRELEAVPTLSGREREVARLAVAGLSNRAIATRLHVSIRTVDNHLHRAYEKLGIRGRAELRDAIGA
jgi:DNA-binding CsgD family transcriptional regulator